MRARSGHRSLAKRVFSGSLRSVLYASQHLGLSPRPDRRVGPGPNGVTTSWTFSLERRCRNDAARFCCHSGGTLLRFGRAPLNSHSLRSVWRTYHIERYRSSVESSSVLQEHRFSHCSGGIGQDIGTARPPASPKRAPLGRQGRPDRLRTPSRSISSAFMAEPCAVKRGRALYSLRTELVARSARGAPLRVLPPQLCHAREPLRPPLPPHAPSK